MTDTLFLTDPYLRDAEARVIGHTPEGGIVLDRSVFYPLGANPGLVKTMSVAPPTGQGRVWLIRIGQGAEKVDLQPCGGTHVARTAEIGRVAIGKIEKKGRQNRRVGLTLID